MRKGDDSKEKKMKLTKISEEYILLRQELAISTRKTTKEKKKRKRKVQKVEEGWLPGSLPRVSKKP